MLERQLDQKQPTRGGTISSWCGGSSTKNSGVTEFKIKYYCIVSARMNMQFRFHLVRLLRANYLYWLQVPLINLIIHVCICSASSSVLPLVASCQLPNTHRLPALLYFVSTRTNPPLAPVYWAIVGQNSSV